MIQKFGIRHKSESNERKNERHLLHETTEQWKTLIRDYIQQMVNLWVTSCPFQA